MVSIYSIQSLIDQLDHQVPTARELDLQSEFLGAGPYLAELINEYQGGPLDLKDTIAPISLGDDVGTDDLPGAIDLPTFHFPGDLDPESVIRELAGKAGDKYRSQKLLNGIDDYGAYLTFHQRAVQWGIYLPMSGIASFMLHHLAHLKIEPIAMFRLAAFLILEHERMHFAIDCMLTQMELLACRPIWWPVRRSVGFAEFRLIEESIANAKMLRSVRYPPSAYRYPGVYQAAVSLSLKQGAGYRDGKIVGRSGNSFEEKILDHAQSAYDLAFNALPPYGVEYQHLSPHNRHYDLTRCPVHIIHDEVRFGLPEIGLRLIRTIPDIHETGLFFDDLKKLGADLKAQWERTKAKLRASVSLNGLDFKPWEKAVAGDTFSVRVNKSVRAHIRFDASSQTWLGERIGRHKEMGHG
jgi:hypothetical protein